MGIQFPYKRIIKDNGKCDMNAKVKTLLLNEVTEVHTSFLDCFRLEVKKKARNKLRALIEKISPVI